MKWSTESEDRVARRIDQLARDPMFEWQVEVVRAVGALPLYADFGSRIGLRKDGRFVAVGLDDLELISIEREMEILATLCGIQRFPDLADVLTSLLPARSADARRCAHCEGTGRLFTTVWCGACFGLGWRTTDGAVP